MPHHDCVAVVPLGWLRDAETKERFWVIRDISEILSF
jgi:hypothetical protein